MHRIRRFEEADWSSVWPRLHAIFLSGDTYAFSPDGTEAEIQRRGPGAGHRIRNVRAFANRSQFDGFPSNAIQSELHLSHPTDPSLERAQAVLSAAGLATNGRP